MSENPDFEQDYWSRTAEGFHKNGRDSIRLEKCLVYCDRFYFGNMNYYDLIGSVLKRLNEISKW